MTERRVNLTPPAPKETPQNAPQALLALCRYHGIFPVFDGFTLDADATLLALCAALHK